MRANFGGKINALYLFQLEMECRHNASLETFYYIANASEIVSLISETAIGSAKKVSKFQSLCVSAFFIGIDSIFSSGAKQHF